jgi:hypothetical protein
VSNKAPQEEGSFETITRTEEEAGDLVDHLCRPIIVCEGRITSLVRSSFDKARKKGLGRLI